MNTIDLWREIPIVAGFIAQLVFLVVYSLPPFGAGEWWRDFTGRALFFMASAIAFLQLAAVNKLIIALTHGIDINTSWNFQMDDSGVIVGYWLVSLAIFYQTSALVIQRFKNRKSAR